MNTYEIHPIALVLPEMSPAEYADLKADIAARGCIVPLVIYEGKILDGRHRYRACRETGQPFYEQFYTEADPAGYVLSLNLKRRNLEAGQRAMVASAMANLKKGQQALEDKCANLRICTAADNQPVITQAEAAKAAGVSRRTVQTAKAVSENAAPEVVDAVKAGTMSLNAAAKTLPKKPDPKPKPPKKPKVDSEFEMHCHRISKIAGEALGKAVLDGTSVVKNLEYFAKLPAEQLKSIAELVIVNRWDPKKALHFIERRLDSDTKIADLTHRAIAAGGTFKCTVGAAEITTFIPTSANW